MAEKAAKDGGEDEPHGLMPPAELRAALKRSGRKPASCVIGLTKDRQAVILLHRLKRPRKLLGEAKAQAKAAGLVLDLASLRFGRVSVSGGSDSAQAGFVVNKPVPPAVQQAMRAPMRAAGHPRFTVNADPSLEDEADGPDEADGDGDADKEDANDDTDPDGDGAGSGSSSGAPGPAGTAAGAPADCGAAPAPPAAAPGGAAVSVGAAGTAVGAPLPGPATGQLAGPGAAPPMALPGVPALKARLTPLVKRVAGAVKAGQPGAERLLAAAETAYGALQAGDLAAAGQGADALERLLGGPAAPDGTAAAAGGTPAPASSAGAAPATVGSAGPGTPVPGGTGQAAPSRAGALKEELAGLVQRVAPAMAADPSRRAPLLKLAKHATARFHAGDEAGVKAGIEALRTALAAAPRPGKDAGAGDGAAGPGKANPASLSGQAMAAGRPKASVPPASKPGGAPDRHADAALLLGEQDRTAGLAGPAQPDADLTAPDNSLPPLPEGDAALVTPAYSPEHWTPPPDAPPSQDAPGRLPPGLVPEVRQPGQPTQQAVTRRVVRTAGRGVGRFLVTKPNPYLMVAGAVLLVAMELMPDGGEESAEATVTLRQQGAGGQPGREVAALHMDGNGALRSAPGGRGPVLGRMDPSGGITLTPAGDAYLSERSKQAEAPGLPDLGGEHDAMGNWTGPGTPGEASPQPARPGPQPGAPETPAEVPAPPAPGTPPLPSPPLAVPDPGFEYDPNDPEEAELVAKMRGRSGMEIQNAINGLRAQRRGTVNTGAGTPPSGGGPVVPGQPPMAQPPARPGAAQPTPRDGVIGGGPVGEPEPINPGSHRNMQDGIRLQAASEDARAAAGYRVERSPVVRPDERLTKGEEDKLRPGELDPLGRIGSVKNPDDRMGGNLADMVAPRSPKLDGVRDALSAKIKLRQAYRLVLNLGRTDVTREQVEALLRRKPIEGLQELFIIEKNGAIFRAFPDPEQITPAPRAR